MHPFPHQYVASASLTKDESAPVHLRSPGLPSLDTGAPAEFDGPGDLWSPETLLTASIADCFNLTFKAIARASRLSYEALHCEVQATLDRVERVTRFTEVMIRPTLTIDDAAAEVKALKLLEKAEVACLITSSLNANVSFQPEVVIAMPGSVAQAPLT